MDIRKVKKLIELLEESNIGEIEIKRARNRFVLVVMAINLQHPSRTPHRHLLPHLRRLRPRPRHLLRRRPRPRPRRWLIMRCCLPW